MYIIEYKSAVTGNTVTSGCASKFEADKQKTALEKEGAKEVKVFPFKPVKIY